MHHLALTLLALAAGLLACGSAVPETGSADPEEWVARPANPAPEASAAAALAGNFLGRKGYTPLVFSLNLHRHGLR